MISGMIFNSYRFPENKFALLFCPFIVLCFLVTGCTARHYREQTDRNARAIIASKQLEALGHTEEIHVEPPEDTLRRKLLIDQNLPRSGPESLGSRDLETIRHWPEKKNNSQGVSTVASTEPFSGPVTITLVEALQIAAENSREYQAAKENLYRTALDLDLRRNDFGLIPDAGVQGSYISDRSTGTTEGIEGSSSAGITRTLRSGASLTGQLGLDLVQLLQPSGSSSRAFNADMSITIPLLRGAGRHIASEPLTQAERDALYAVWNFERFKKTFAVSVVDNYLSVLESEDQLRNQEENYRGLIASTRRAARLAEAGKLTRIQVDQSIQNELRARNRWVASRQAYSGTMDNFKILLGLPADADLQLDRNEFTRLNEYIRNNLSPLFIASPEEEVPPGDSLVKLEPPRPDERGRFELEQEEACRLALENRVDLRIAKARVLDAQRQVIVAADALRAELTLFGSASFGEHRSLATATSGTSNRLDFSKGYWLGLLTLDLPLERTAEAIAYRDSYISLEQAVRDVQELEDKIKLEVRGGLRNLEQARASLKIQEQAVKLAERRVRGAALNLEAGRAQIRDLLESQEALLSAQNALTSAMVDYRVAELAMQRDLGILMVDALGLRVETSKDMEMP